MLVATLTLLSDSLTWFNFLDTVIIEVLATFSK